MVAEICGLPLLRQRRKRSTKAADQMPTRELATAMVSTSGIAESAKLLMVIASGFSMSMVVGSDECLGLDPSNPRPRDKAPYEGISRPTPHENLLRPEPDYCLT